MPYINSNDRPSFLPPPHEPVKNSFNSKNSPVKPVSDPMNSHEEKIVPGSQVSGQPKSILRYKFERSLDKDPKIRRELAKGLKKPLYSKEVDKAIQDIKAELPKSFGSVIDANELRSLGSARKQSDWYSQEKQLVRELSKDGFTREEIKQHKRSNFKTDFFKHLLGLDKDKK